MSDITEQLSNRYLGEWTDSVSAPLLSYLRPHWFNQSQVSSHLNPPPLKFTYSKGSLMPSAPCHPLYDKTLLFCSFQSLQKLLQCSIMAGSISFQYHVSAQSRIYHTAENLVQVNTYFLFKNIDLEVQVEQSNRILYFLLKGFQNSLSDRNDEMMMAMRESASQTYT